MPVKAYRREGSRDEALMEILAIGNWCRASLIPRSA